MSLLSLVVRLGGYEEMKSFAYQMLLLCYTSWITVHKNLQLCFTSRIMLLICFFFSVLDYIQCPYCQRRFNENAADRHINFCKEQAARISNKGKFSTDTKGKATSRTQVKCSIISTNNWENDSFTVFRLCFTEHLATIFLPA